MAILHYLHQLHAPLVAFMGLLPVIGRRSPEPAALAGPLRKNVHVPTDRPVLKAYRPDKARILSGDPAQTVQLVFKSEDERFSMGIWECRPGKWRIDFAEHEFIHILEGVVIVTDAEGDARTYRAGAAFVSPAGFSGTWDVIEPVRKYFTLYAEPAATESVSRS